MEAQLGALLAYAIAIYAVYRIARHFYEKRRDSRQK
jgi:hypothetical protein